MNEAEGLLLVLIGLGIVACVMLAMIGNQLDKLHDAMKKLREL